MVLLEFKLPAEEVKLIEHEGTVYKIKTRYESDCAFLPCSQQEVNKEVDLVLRSLLHTKVFSQIKLKTEHFYVDCHTYRWDALHVIGFVRDNIRLKAHPLVMVMVFKPKEKPQDFRSEPKTSFNQSYSINEVSNVSITKESENTSIVMHSSESSSGPCETKITPEAEETVQSEQGTKMILSTSGGISTNRENSESGGRTNKESSECHHLNPKYPLVDLGKRVQVPYAQEKLGKIGAAGDFNNGLLPYDRPAIDPEMKGDGHIHPRKTRNAIAIQEFGSPFNASIKDPNQKRLVSIGTKGPEDQIHEMSDKKITMRSKRRHTLPQSSSSPSRTDRPKVLQKRLHSKYSQNQESFPDGKSKLLATNNRYMASPQPGRKGRGQKRHNRHKRHSSFGKALENFLDSFC